MLDASYGRESAPFMGRGEDNRLVWMLIPPSALLNLTVLDAESLVDELSAPVVGSGVLVRDSGGPYTAGAYYGSVSSTVFITLPVEAVTTASDGQGH